MTKKLSLEEAKPQTCADSSNPADAIRRCEGAREDPQIGDEAGYLRHVAKREESSATAPANPELRGGARQSDVAKQGGQGNAQQ